MVISKITLDQYKKILKAALYVSVSAGLAQLIAVTTEQPALLGVLTPVVNVGLVTLKQLFTEAQ